MERLVQCIPIGGGGLGAKSCPILVTPWTVACQAPLSIGFPGQNTGVGSHSMGYPFLKMKSEKKWVAISSPSCVYYLGSILNNTSPHLLYLSPFLPFSIFIANPRHHVILLLLTSL